jgi:hypothetical protein
VANEPENLTLQFMRRFDVKLDRLIEDVGDIKVRLTAVEEAVNGTNRRLDRLESRGDRIERRLELVDLPPDGVRE